MSLADRRAQSGNRPRLIDTQTMTRVEGKNLLAEQKRLTDALLDLAANNPGAVDENGERIAEPRKSGQKSASQRAEEIKAELSGLTARLAEFQDEITVEGVLSGGEWHLWKEAHPAREDSDVDRALAGNWCNASDLFADLGKFVAEVNGEAVAEGDWDEWLAEDYIYADRRELVKAVVGLYELRVDRAPKSPSVSSETPAGETA